MKWRAIVLFLLISGVLHAQEKHLRPALLYEQAERAYDAGDFARAIALLDVCLRASEAWLEAYPLRASAKVQLNDLDGALVDYSVYLEHVPDHLGALLGRAVLRYRLGFYEQAREDLLRLLVLPPPEETNTLYFKKGVTINDRAPIVTTTGGSHRSHIYNYLGLTEWKLGNSAHARVCFDSAIRLNPYEADYYVNRGLLRESLGDENAFVDYEHAVRLNPQHSLALHNQRAWNARHKNSLTDEERLTRTIEDDPGILYPYLERAQERFQRDDYAAGART